MQHKSQFEYVSVDLPTWSSLETVCVCERGRGREGWCMCMCKVGAGERMKCRID